MTLATPPLPATTARRALTFIFIAVVLDVIAFGVTIPVLPRLIEGLLDGNVPQAARMYGVFGTVWALMQFICSPLLGMLSDRFGRRPVILFSLFGLGVDYIVMALAPTVAWLFIGRVVSGIAGASYTTASAYIADVTTEENRAAGFGMIGAAWGLGFVLGPAIGGIFGESNPRLPFWIAAALTLLNSLYGLFVLPESLPREKRATSLNWSRANPLGAFKLLRSHHELFGIATINLLYNIAHQVLPSAYVIYVSYRYSWNSRTVGIVLAVVGICSAVVQGGLVRPLVRRLGERRALLLGLLAACSSFTIYGFAPTTAWFLAGIPIGAFAGLYAPSAQGIMTRRVKASEQGQLQGAISSVQGIGGLIGPGIFTLTLAYFIGPGQQHHLPGAPFLLAGAIVAIAMTTAVWVTRTP